MITQFEKGKKESISAHFSSTDFDCHCVNPDCTTTFVDLALIDGLEELLDLTGTFKINSGFRCKKHNEAVGGEKGSFHMLGKAADIEALNGLPGPEMAKYANMVPTFEKGGMGVNFQWIHVDCRGNRARWTYPVLHS